MSNIAKCKLFGCPIFQGRSQYTQITTIYIVKWGIMSLYNQGLSQDPSCLSFGQIVS